MSRHRCPHLFERFALHIAALGVELVGIADQPLKQCLRHIVARGERERQLCNILSIDSGTGVSPGYGSYRLIHPFSTQKSGSEQSVADIWLRPMAVDAGRVGEEYTDIMEHSSSLDIGLVKQQRLAVSNLKSQISHRPTVADINIPQGCACGIIFVNNFLIVHTGIYSMMVFQP